MQYKKYLYIISGIVIANCSSDQSKDREVSKQLADSNQVIETEVFDSLNQEEYLPDSLTVNLNVENNDSLKAIYDTPIQNNPTMSKEKPEGYPTQVPIKRR